MNLTTKQLMLILMSVLLVLVVVMGAIVFSRLGNLLQMSAGVGGNNNNQNPVPTASSTGFGNSAPSSVATQPAETTIPHECEYSIKGDTFSPTCDSFGYTLYYCECGNMDISQNMIEPLGHRYGTATIVAATCTEDGWTERTCNRCSYVEKTSPTKAGHEFGLWEDVAVDAPINQQRTCDICHGVEFKSLDEEKTWTIFKSTMEPIDTYAYFQILLHVDEDSKNDILVEIYSALADDTFEFDYTDDGLVLYYTVDETAMTHIFDAEAEFVTIEVDGSISDEKPVAADPEDPENPDDPENPEDPEDPEEGTTGTENPEDPEEGTTGGEKPDDTTENDKPQEPSKPTTGKQSHYTADDVEHMMSNKGMSLEDVRDQLVEEGYPAIELAWILSEKYHTETEVMTFMLVHGETDHYQSLSDVTGLFDCSLSDLKKIYNS